MTNNFEWPSPSELRQETLDNLIQSKLIKLAYHVGGSVWALQATMSDGRQSPVIGTRNVLDAYCELDPDIHIGQIQVLESSDKKYVRS